MSENYDEARRIVSNMARMSLYHGSTTAEVVDEIFKNFSNPIYCNGYAMNMVFTPITQKTFSFKLEPA